MWSWPKTAKHKVRGSFNGVGRKQTIARSSSFQQGDNEESPSYNSIQFEQPLLRGRMHTAIEFFKLFFTEELENDIVKHTNSYAVQQITEGTHQSYAHADGSWKDTTPEEIYRLIAFLIYFCFN